VNKPSGVQTDGFHGSSLLPQVFKIFKCLHPDKKKLDKFQLVQRLDKFVTGGVIVSRDEKFTKRINKYLAGKPLGVSVSRRYVGLIPLPNLDDLKVPVDLLNYGTISYDIELVKDRTKQMYLYPAETKFKVLPHLKVSPTSWQLAKYPQLYSANTFIYPIILELTTGRKNQIRDHILQAFGRPLMNDDNFLQFKLLSKDFDSTKVNINSVAFKSNQIGLHSAYINLYTPTKNLEEIIFPIHEIEDRELWTGFVDQDGQLIEELKQEVINFKPNA
jgi:21S rRNA pseudouridine2819 synthase